MGTTVAAARRVMSPGGRTVWHISTYDAMGGAARAARRVHDGVLGLGLDSHMLVFDKTSDAERVHRFVQSKNFLVRARRRLRRSFREREYGRYSASRRDAFQPFSDDRTDYPVRIDRLDPHPDVVCLYWIAGFADLQTLLSPGAQTVPVIWRLSDANAFTGGCHYPCECDRYTGMCGACPELGSSSERDLSRAIWLRKQAAYRTANLHIVSPSRWLAREASRSGLLGDKPITVIPTGLNDSIFKPQDRKSARAALGLPADDLIIMAAADHLEDRRKGTRFLSEAVRSVTDLQAMLVTVGGGSDGLLDGSLLPVRHLGHMTDDRQLARAYSAADVFVVPSVYENLPNTALEALACGVPVVGFAAGGIPEIVRHGETGLIARWQDATDLGTQLRRMLDNPVERAQMGVAARLLIEREHTLEIQARRFVELFDALDMERQA